VHKGCRDIQRCLVGIEVRDRVTTLVRTPAVLVMFLFDNFASWWPANESYRRRESEWTKVGEGRFVWEVWRKLGH